MDEIKQNIKYKIEEKMYNLTNKKDTPVWLQYNKLLKFALNSESNLGLYRQLWYCANQSLKSADIVWQYPCC